MKKNQQKNNCDLATEDEVKEETCCGEQNVSELKENTDDMASLRETIKSLEDQYLRANADFENIKRRLEKEKYQAVEYANEVFARDLLAVVDALDMAYKIVSEVENDEISNKIKEGIALTLEQFKKVFEKHGIKAADEGGEFDPNIHNAMMRVDSDEFESGQIVQCFQKGYMIKDRVLRPAMVSVAK